MIRLFAFCILLFSFNAQAYSGKELLEDCRAAEAAFGAIKPENPAQSQPANRCLAYINGFADAYDLGEFLAGKVGVQLGAFCLPTGDDAEYRRLRAVLTHLERQPPNSQASPRTLVAGAFSKSFPCSQ